MNDTITPRLRADVLVHPFDTFEGDNRFIVAVDDRHFLVSAAVAAILVESRTHSTLATLAHRASERLGLTVSPELASRVLSEELLAICFQATEPRADVASPIRMRKQVLEAHALEPLLAMLAPLFTRPAAVALISLLVVVELCVAGRAASAIPHTLSGAQIMCAAALTAFGIFVHEMGHLSACARFGAAHGGIGFGIYWCMPVLYAEVNGAWMLPRLQRAAVDVGGIYFQCAFVMALGIAYLVSGAPPLLEAIVWSHVLMLHTLNPVLKYDGYWLLTDLAGAANLHAQIRECAQKAWRLVRRAPDARWPDAKLLALFGGFAALAIAYFAYVISVLGHNIGHSAGEVATRWASHDSAPFGLWHAVGESALLALLLVIGLSIAVLLARSLHRIGKDSPA